MDLETSLDKMCMGVEELNFRMARIEIAIRKQNIRIRVNDPVIIIKDISSVRSKNEEQGQFCP